MRNRSNWSACSFQEELNQYNERHAEMISLFPDIEHAGPAEHLMQPHEDGGGCDASR
ncbi:MAG: hypothetical protein MZV63_46345 [Marinilabiliales bacterium]|nr:hypothetical protein [Marinilabiliales bacterium]